MKFFVLSVIIALAVVRSDCELQVTLKRNYCRKLLVSDLTYPDTLVMDYNSNDLYFSHWAKNMSHIKTMRLNLNANELYELPGMEHMGRVTVNHEANEVFVGGSHGIYKYDPISNTSIFLGAGDKNIWKMYYKDMIYFSTFPDQKLYRFKNGKYKLFKDLETTTARHYVIDNNDNMFYINRTGFYKQRKGTEAELVFAEDDFTLRDLVFDPSGDLYLGSTFGLFYVNKQKLTLESIGEVFPDGGFAFDKSGNLYYADQSTIYKLAPKRYLYC